MNHRVVGCGLLLCSLLLILVTSVVARTQEEVTIRFGALPVLQALPLFAAKEKGLFEKAGVRVDLIPFNTTADKDIALSAGSIDGCFADLVTPTVLIGNGRDVKIVATNYNTATDRRMFAVLAKPSSNYKSLKDLAGVPVAISSNSVIHYVTDRLLGDAGVPRDKIETVEVKNIGMRMQMLLSGQVEAATLPEPLVTAAVAKGATLLGDDAGLPTSQTVLIFSGRFLKKHPAEVKAFLAAVNGAGTLIAVKPEEARAIMVKSVRLPEPLKATYPVPRFPRVHAPDSKSVRAIALWLKGRGVIKPELTYEQVVDAAHIP